MTTRFGSWAGLWLGLAAFGVFAAVASAGASAQRSRGGGGGAATPSGDAQNGRALYASKNCERCHGAAGEGTGAGPQLAGGALAFTNFLSQLRNPRDTMPAVAASDVSDAQAADIYAFVGSLGDKAGATTVAGNADNGKKIFTAYGCYECHGRAAQGGAGPKLGPRPIPLASMIKELRHPGQMPPYTEKVVSDAEIADIRAFLQSLPEPPKPDSIPLLSKQ